MCFLQVIQLLEQRRQSAAIVHVAYNALRAVDANGTEAMALWSVIFKHELSMEHYTEAFVACVSNPDVGRYAVDLLLVAIILLSL